METAPLDVPDHPASQARTEPAINRRTTDHLANERTFLAWVRTSIAVTGLGFVVARFGIWLRELSARMQPSAPPLRHTGLSLPLGVAMMAAGGLLAVLAAGRYHRVRQAIDRNDPAAAGQAVTAVTLVVLAISAALVTYMLATH
jgi:putative membrane protein